MLRITGGLLVCLLAWPALADDDKSKDKDKQSPAEQVKAIIKEYQDAQRDFSKAYQEAKTEEDRQKIIKEKYPQPDKFAPRLLAVAEKNSKDQGALDALIWVVTNIYESGKDSPRAKALHFLLTDHVQSDKLANVCQALANVTNAEEEEAFLRAVLEKNKNDDVQGETLLALGLRLGQVATVARTLQGNAEMAKQYEQYYGKDYVDKLLKTDPAKVESEGEQFYRRFAENHLAKLKDDRVQSLCQRFGRSADKGGELVLRTVLEKNAKREVQGVACLALGQLLKKRAEGIPESHAEEAKKVQKEAEQFLTRAQKDYGDVKAGYLGSVARHADGELFELLHLGKGMAVPDIEGEDLDGQKFNLSNYRGKVVLIDFWGNW
jgi:hypothetical protein